ncbi:MAG: methionine--tRNA ligase [Planctomycetota bacterium]
MDRYYITTPIYYPNGEPHLGHVYTTICADAVARYHRMAGREVFFLTGTDEHGVKMVNTAKELGVEPAELADRFSATFREAFERLQISNDDFIRTVEPRHENAVQEIVRRMVESGDIYKDTYTGWYDEGEERFVPENEAAANDYKSDISGKPLVRHEEESYFFRLTKYLPKLVEHIETHPNFIQPDARRNKVLAELKGEVSDLSISRGSLTWGVPMPNDPSHVVYVWIDALSNYINALGYTSEDETKFEKFWPVSRHLIGKEILWFHTVYWPAMLMSLGLPLPQQVFAHGWWTADGKKMSKSMGNFIGLAEVEAFAEKYSLDAVRYYLLWAAPFGNDLDFSAGELHRSYEELQKVLGNLVQRVLKMVTNYRDGVVPSGTLEAIDTDLLHKGRELPVKLDAAWCTFALQDAATLPIELAREVNAYIDQTEPFKLAKDESQAQRLDAVLQTAVVAVHAVLAGLLPVLPEKAAAGLAQLNADANTAIEPGHKLGKPEALFPRVDPPVD